MQGDIVPFPVSLPLPYVGPARRCVLCAESVQVGNIVRVMNNCAVHLACAAKLIDHAIDMYRERQWKAEANSVLPAEWQL